MNINLFNRLIKIASGSDERFIYDLARQLAVTENDSSIHIPVLPNGRLDMSGTKWYNPKMGIRTQINKDQYASALGTGQVTAPTYLDAARLGHMPAKWFITNPNKIKEFYQLALDMRPEAAKKDRAQAGVNSIGKAIQEWQKRYGENSIGDYGRYVLGIHTGTGVKHGEDTKLPIQFHRDSYEMIINTLKSRLGRIRTANPTIPVAELRKRLAYSWNQGAGAKYDANSPYLRIFNRVGERIADFDKNRAAVAAPQSTSVPTPQTGSVQTKLNKLFTKYKSLNRNSPYFGKWADAIKREMLSLQKLIKQK